MSQHRPRKRFGQNFLHDQSVIDNIVAAIKPQADQHIVEIGPGQGALTIPLLASAAKITAIEIDRDLIAKLTSEKRFAGLSVVEGDVLDVDFSQISPSPFRLVGNLPYNISSPILFKALEQLTAIADMHFMLQKEVVDRMAAGPGSKTYGRLSVMVQYYCEVDTVLTVKPGAFFPPPKVDSAVVRLNPKPFDQRNANDAKVLARVVQQAFSQRRKTLRNSLKSMVATAQMEELDIEPSTRPEQLGVSEFVALANAVAEDPTQKP